jgi:hypothetical protein
MTISEWPIWHWFCLYHGDVWCNIGVWSLIVLLVAATIVLVIDVVWVIQHWRD